MWGFLHFRYLKCFGDEMCHPIIPLFLRPDVCVGHSISSSNLPSFARFLTVYHGHLWGPPPTFPGEQSWDWLPQPRFPIYRGLQLRQSEDAWSASMASLQAENPYVVLVPWFFFGVEFLQAKMPWNWNGHRYPKQIRFCFFSMEFATSCLVSMRRFALDLIPYNPDYFQSCFVFFGGRVGGWRMTNIIFFYVSYKGTFRQYEQLK